MNYLHLLKLFSISIGAGGGSVGGVFSLQKALVKITIEDLIKEDLFDGKENNDWKILKKKLLDDKNENEKNLELTGLKSIKKKTENEGNEIKTWCQNKRTFSFKKYLPSRMENLILHHLKLFCIMTIEEKLGEDRKIKSFKENKEKINEKANELKNHSEDNDSERGKIDDLELKKIKEEENEKDTDKRGRDLLKWCKDSYKKIYTKKRTENLWKLTNYYCKLDSDL